MKLTSRSVIAMLFRPPAAARRLKSKKAAAPEFRPVKSRRRCTCGECPRCQEDARWERIFNEKFADPEYYAHRLPRGGSSLLAF
jgi:hypothetical protein